MKIIKSILFSLVILLSGFAGAASADQITIFSTDFSSGAPGEFSGVVTTESVQGYNGIGGFADNFLRNSTTGNPASKTTLTLTGLQKHESINLNFLLAVIDSWDGSNTTESWDPDYFNVSVDGNTIFKETYAHYNTSNQSAPVENRFSFGTNLGFNSEWNDSAYDMGMLDAFNNIAHTEDTLTVLWWASGSGWQGGDDESWAIDNIEVVLNVATVPVPPAMLLFGSGLLGLVGLRKRSAK